MRVTLDAYGFSRVEIEVPALPRRGDFIRPEFFADRTPTGRIKGGVLAQVVVDVHFYPAGVVIGTWPLDDDPRFGLASRKGVLPLAQRLDQGFDLGPLRPAVAL